MYKRKNNFANCVFTNNKLLAQRLYECIIRFMKNKKEKKLVNV